MKYIFDFDDVLFYTTLRRNEHLYPYLHKKGISRDAIDTFNEKARGNLFSMKHMLSYFSLNEELYEEVMYESEKFANRELIDIIKKLGKNNCYIVTYGDEEFQLDKIKRIGIESLFAEIIIVNENKKNAVEAICSRHPNEKVIFVDDKAMHFEQLDFQKHPNLKTILFDEHGLEKLKEEIMKDA